MGAVLRFVNLMPNSGGKDGDLSELCQHGEQSGKQPYKWKAFGLIFATCFLSLHHQMETSQVLLMPQLLSHH